MSFEADAIVDRRRLRRRLSQWRIVAIIALIVAIGIAIADPTSKRLPVGDHIAKLDVFGLILEDAERNQAITELAEDSNTKALIVMIDSPGGTTSGAEGLYLALRELSETKPVVAVMQSVAASGGYITAIGADHIIARQNTITGSIGVLFQNTEFSGLMDKVGVQVDLITSGPLKGKPSPYAPLDEQGRAAINDLIMDSYDWFIGLVSERREISVDQARKLGDGRVYSGRMALENKLIDQIGGQGEAVDWLAQEHGLNASLPVRDLAYGDPPPLVDRLVNNIAIGISEKTLGTESLNVDGLVSIWHP